MNGHPGGREHTLRMAALSGLTSGKILDVGAGNGESVRLLNESGFDAIGIDLAPRDNSVIPGNMLAVPYADAAFDGVLSQCSLFVTGDIPGALREIHRILMPGGVLMLSDVCFENREALLRDAGFEIVFQEDMTPQWREYYLEALWNGTAEPCEIKGKCSYRLFICKKR